MTNPTDHDMLERARSIAKLIYTEFPDIQASQLEGPTRRTFEDAEMRGYPRQKVAMRLTKAIIAALSTPAIPDGFRLVLVEVETLLMLIETAYGVECPIVDQAEKVRAMLAAATSPSPTAKDHT